MKLNRLHIESPLGPMILAGSNAGLAGVWFEQNQQHMPEYSSWSRIDHHPVLDQARDEIRAYFDGELKAFTVGRTAAWGTEFQREVWEALMSIPFGVTMTYGEIARRINRPQAVRAIGGAIGRNPWTILTPCHRVIGADGALTGYAGGLERKVALLQLEGVNV